MQKQAMSQAQQAQLQQIMQLRRLCYNQTDLTSFRTFEQLNAYELRTIVMLLNDQVFREEAGGQQRYCLLAQELYRHVMRNSPRNPYTNQRLTNAQIRHIKSMYTLYLLLTSHSRNLTFEEGEEIDQLIAEGFAE